jgi:hypothetical protein
MPAQDLIIKTLRGGQNDTDPPTELQDDEVVLAENVEFFYSALGERRLGCGPLTITSSHLDDEDLMVYLTQWAFDNDILDQQIFAVSATPGTSATVAVRTNGVWDEIDGANLTDALNTSVPAIYQIDTEALNQKLFVAYRSAVDRLHVWDGTNLRRTGLAEPNPPTVADTAVAGSYTGTRYFRVCVARLSGTTVISRSEPSTTVTFVPNGSFNGAVITQPAVLPGEGETHWIIEASTDNSIFYDIETLLIATTTYTDTTAFADGYEDQGPESPQIGDFDLIPSFKFLAVDGDRLVMGGHYTDQTLMSTIAWTPVQNDPGGSNDERLPLDVDNTKNLDNTSGGPLTGICSSDFGTWYAFKFQAIYRMMRTGDGTDAYDVICMSKTRGAVEGSIFPGYTEDGSSCIYFLDPFMGPSRVGSFGIQTIVGLRGTWGRVNLQASGRVACGCFYPYKQQAHWWVAVDGNDRPNFKIINQVSELRPMGGDAVGRGWSTATGTITEAACVSIITEVVSIDGVSSISQRPFVGLVEPNFIQRCDTEDEDAGDPYVATILTRPYIMAGQLNQFGAMVASILAEANSTYQLDIAFIRDFGKETNEVTSISLAPTGSETEVFKLLDDLRMSEARSIQIRIMDAG